MKPRLNVKNFPTAKEEAEAVTPPSRYEGPESAYRLAFTDTEFLLREELRPVRMQLELLKPEMIQKEQGIESTVVIFGSARVLPPETADELLAIARESGDAAAVRSAEVRVRMSHYYREAQRFGAIVTTKSRGLETPI
jgi:hypothetical protein